MLEDVPKIIVREGMVEKEAFQVETALIIALGRIDIKTRCLTNLTNGGDGASGSRLSDAAKAIRGEKVSRALQRLSSEERSERARLNAANRTPEQRRDTALKGARSQTSEQHKARVRRGVESQTSEQLRDRALKGAANQTPEQRKNRSIKAYASRNSEEKARTIETLNNSRTSEERSISTKRWMAAKTPEERSASARKIWGTRIKNGTAYDARSPEERSKSILKTWETRRKNTPPKPPKLCNCGCGSIVKSGKADYIRGHNHKIIGSKWITDGYQNKRLPKSESMPEGWKFGKIERSNHTSEVWWSKTQEERDIITTKRGIAVSKTKQKKKAGIIAATVTLDAVLSPKPTIPDQDQ
jgi:hypothetical protein